MKKQLTVLALLVVVFVLTGVAIVYSNDHKARAAAAQSSQVKKLQAQLSLHDAVNTTNIKNLSDQVIILKQQKATLCTQIKATKLVQPLCQ